MWANRLMWGRPASLCNTNEATDRGRHCLAKRSWHGRWPGKRLERLHERKRTTKREGPKDQPCNMKSQHPKHKELAWGARRRGIRKESAATEAPQSKQATGRPLPAGNMQESRSATLPSPLRPLRSEDQRNAVIHGLVRACWPCGRPPTLCVVVQTPRENLTLMLAAVRVGSRRVLLTTLSSTSVVFVFGLVFALSLMSCFPINQEATASFRFVSALACSASAFFAVAFSRTIAASWIALRSRG